MRIQVKLSDGLSGFREESVDLTDGSTAADLIARLSLPVAEVGLLSVNGRQATFDQRLHPQDVVTIVPPLGGG